MIGAIENWLDQMASECAISRGRSVQWEPGYVFSPWFAKDGSLLFIYEESDVSFGIRVIRKSMNDAMMDIVSGINEKPFIPY